MSSCLLVQWPSLLFRDAVVSWININGDNAVTKSKSGPGIDLVFLSKLLPLPWQGKAPLWKRPCVQSSKESRDDQLESLVDNSLP